MISDYACDFSKINVFHVYTSEVVRFTWSVLYMLVSKLKLTTVSQDL